jgi:drug/metabolite transporter (DMT)-like permease
MPSRKQIVLFAVGGSLFLINGLWSLLPPREWPGVVIGFLGAAACGGCAVLVYRKRGEASVRPSPMRTRLLFLVVNLSVPVWALIFRSTSDFSMPNFIGVMIFSLVVGNAALMVGMKLRSRGSAAGRDEVK